MEFFLNIDPKSKYAFKKKLEVQKLFIESMKERKFKKLYNKIAVEITAYTSSNTPPQIEKFIKNIVDLMHKKEILFDKSEEQYLPFEEDKYIKYLRAKYVFIPGNSEVHIKIRPFSSFLSDIRFVDSEIGLNYKAENNLSNNLREKYQEYQEYIDNKDKYVKFLSDEAYESMLKLNILDIQKEIADSISISPEIVQLIYPKNKKYLKEINEIYIEWANILMKMPIRIQLPGIPVNEQKDKSYKSVYKNNLINQMKRYLEKNKIFKKLQSPILVSVFYMPPKTKKKDYKDIDNIMLEYIMPSINEVFSPPISIFNTHMKKPIKDEFIYCNKAIPKSLNGSSIGYEIIELPDSFSEEKSGFLNIGFKIENVERSIMEYIDHEIDNYIENNQNVDL